MKARFNPLLHLSAALAFTCAGSAHAADGAFSWTALGGGDNDANVGLSSSKTYLNAVNVQGSALNINGVSFEGSSGGNPTGTNYAISGVSTVFGSGAAGNVGGQLGSLIDGFIYGGNPQTLTLNSLIAGQTYSLALYNRSWDQPTGRTQNITTTGGAATSFNEDFNASGDLNILRYTFTATGTSETINFANNGAATFHFYGFSTEQTFNNTWSSGADWSTASWSLSQPNGVGSNADFTAQGSPTSINLDANRTVGHIRFDGANAWTISGANTLTLQADAGGVSVIGANSGSHTISTALGLNNSLLKSGAGTVNLTNSVSGAANITVGAGTLSLTGNNSYSGQTDIQAGGTLLAASNTALGQGGWNGNTMSFIQNGATLALQGGVSLDEHFHVWGSGVGGLGAVRSISGNNALTMTWGGGGGGPGFALRSNTTVGVDADTLTATGFYEEGGSWGLTKIGAGTLHFNQESWYTGGTTVNAGTLILDGSGGGNSRLRGALTVNNGATVSLINDDGTGLGFNGGAKVTSLTINGGTLTTASVAHIWNLNGGGGVNMTGGTLQGNNGVSDPNGSQLEWNYADVTTNASANTATIGGRIRMRADGGYGGITFTVANGDASTDLLVSAAVTEASGGLGISKAGAGTMVLSGDNSYSGVTTLGDGIINVASIANNGTSSSLGVGTGDTDANAIGLLFRGGTLQYTGSTAQSTNRQIRLSTTGGGGTIDASGSNPSATLSFTATSSVNFFENPGNRTLTLTGSNTGDNTFGMAIGEAGGTTSLVKSGTGKWVLTGSNTYTGNTTVSEGTLSLTSTSQMQFVVTDAPASNQITGAGTATFDGVFNINTAAVNGTTGYIWLLVDRANLTGESFGSNFSVAGFEDPEDDGIWTMTDAKGNWSFSEESGELTLDIGNDYDTWKTANGVTGGVNDDDDSDGLTNHEEYAFGTDPTGGSEANPIVSQLNKTTGKFSYTRRKIDLPDPTLDYSVWFSTDLATWTEDTGATEGTPALNGEVETVEVTLSSLPGNPLPAKLFIQVRAN